MAVDRLMAARRLSPRLFTSVDGSWAPVARRAAATTVLFLLFWVAVFSPLGTLGAAPQIDVNQLRIPQLFLIHALLLVALVAWYACGFLGGPRAAGSGWSTQFGLRTSQPWTELGLGLGVGLVTWLLVLLFLIGLGVVLWSLGGSEVLPTEPPVIIPWIASLPILVRLAISASAGFFEELFFRGFLQPRIGIGFSTALFVLAHASYEQPLMLVGVAVLSLVFSFLVKWRQSIWAAVVAHTVFDAIQLLFVIPGALRFIEAQA